MKDKYNGNAINVLVLLPLHLDVGGPGVAPGPPLPRPLLALLRVAAPVWPGRGPGLQQGGVAGLARVEEGRRGHGGHEGEDGGLCRHFCVLFI